MPGEHDHEHEIVDHEMTGAIGTAILIGFIAMLLIDEGTQALIAQNKAVVGGKFRIVFHKGLGKKEAKDIKAEEKINSALLTTIALCIHSLTEGVAMGASLFCKKPLILT